MIIFPYEIRNISFARKISVMVVNLTAKLLGSQIRIRCDFMDDMRVYFAFIPSKNYFCRLSTSA